LDEPTSGLDSSTALVLCSALKRIAESGQATVICTIHQPQQKIFMLFDDLLLLKQGKIVFQGSCQKSVFFLEAIGMPCPAGTNPADHLIEVISPHHDDETLREGVRTVPIDLSMGVEKHFHWKKDGVNWLQQFSILCRRNLQQYVRRVDIILINFISTSLIACFIGGGIWYQQQNTYTQATTLPPSLFFGCVTQGIFASLQCVNSFPGERTVMLRERAAGSYYVSAYFMAKTAIDMLTNLWPPVLFTCIAYPMLGYQYKASKFFIYMAFMILDNMAAVSLSIAGWVTINYFIFIYFYFF
jgi:ATP-binding cassette subfamily G (WHITE) protein 2